MLKKSISISPLGLFYACLLTLSTGLLACLHFGGMTYLKRTSGADHLDMYMTTLALEGLGALESTPNPKTALVAARNLKSWNFIAEKNEIPSSGAFHEAMSKVISSIRAIDTDAVFGRPNSNCPAGMYIDCWAEASINGQLPPPESAEKLLTAVRSNDIRPKLFEASRQIVHQNMKAFDEVFLTAVHVLVVINSLLLVPLFASAMLWVHCRLKKTRVTLPEA